MRHAHGTTYTHHVSDGEDVGRQFVEVHTTVQCDVVEAVDAKFPVWVDRDTHIANVRVDKVPTKPLTKVTYERILR